MREQRLFFSILQKASLALISALAFAPTRLPAISIFDEPTEGGLPVLEMSGVFADIYEKLDGVKWGGKDLRTAIEGIENISSMIKIAATDNRIVVLHKDTIIGNWPRPKNGEWRDLGQITTAVILKMREIDPAIADMTATEIYKAAVGAMMKGLDENGKYIYSKRENEDSAYQVLTSLGIAGVRASSGDYVLNTIFKGSPADNAGLADGDVLVSANGVALRDLSDAEILGLFNGFSSGTIKIRAIGADRKEKSATLRRASVVIADADVIVKDKLLEIIINRVSNNAAEIIAGVLDGRADIEGIYLDLRGATGDDEKAMAKIAGLFLGKVPVARVSMSADDDVEIVPGGDKIVDAPIVVAVSNATSGTAEGLAYAFYEAGVGAIIGVPTAGRARLATRVDLNNGGALEISNRTMKSGKNRQIDGRGFFPLVCLSNIRNSDHKEVFLVNVRNHDWKEQDFNGEEFDAKTVRKGCPNISSGSDEDAVSQAVAMDLLTSRAAYNNLKGRRPTIKVFE